MKLGDVGSKSRSLCQILEKPCVHSRVHSFDPKFLNVNPHEIWVRFKTGTCLGKTLVARKLSTVHKFDQKFMKLCQNVNNHEI